MSFLQNWSRQREGDQETADVFAERKELKGSGSRGGRSVGNIRSLRATNGQSLIAARQANSQHAMEKKEKIAGVEKN